MRLKRGPTIVYLPGTHGNDAFYGSFRTRFPQRAGRCLTYPVNSGWDLNGYTEWLKKELGGLRSYVLLAESFGSLLAIAHGAEDPAGLRGIVFLGGFVRSPYPMLPSWIAHLVPSPQNQFMSGIGASLLLEKGNRNHYELDEVSTALTGLSRRDLRDRLRVVLKADLRDQLSRIRAPFIALQGSDDRIVPLRALDLFRAAGGVAKVIKGPHFLGNGPTEHIDEAVEKMARSRR